MRLAKKHVDALAAAEQRMLHCDFCAYLDLKELLLDDSKRARWLFRDRFTSTYGLNVGGLTDDFKDRFFTILFDEEVIVRGRPDFKRILAELGTFKRKTGNKGMPFSFVSKLVAMRDEGSPIYDRHVANFFGMRPPGTKIDANARIDAFVALLGDVARDYRTWAADERIAPVLAKFKARDARLKKCDAVRLMDFLVWKVGNQKLLIDPSGRPPGALHAVPI